MLNQHLSMNAFGRVDQRATSLVPVPTAQALWSADPTLTARLTRVAAASCDPSPQVIPGAAVLLLPLHLPLKSQRKRKAALPFVMEPFLAAPLEHTHVALGSVVEGETWLCAAINRDLIHDFMSGSEAAQNGPMVPDILAVPVPPQGADWTIWCADEIIYVRCKDSGGLCVPRPTFPDLWRAQNRPKIALAYGTAPPEVSVTTKFSELPEPDPSVLDLDLALQGARDITSQGWKGHARFAAIMALLAICGHSTLLHFDALALSRLTAARAADFDQQLVARGVPLDLSLPTPALARALTRSGQASQTADFFLALLAQITQAMPQHSVRVRDLRYDGSARAMTLLVTGNDLTALQQLEGQLKAQGLAVTSGSATQSAAGAELQLFVNGAG